MTDKKSFTAWFEDVHAARRDRLPQLLQYGEELLRVTETLALISRGDRHHFWTRHLKECLEPGFVGHLETRKVGLLLDVGSGNGLPGLPLALMIPELKVTLLEPRKKKAGFLDRVILLLGVPNVRVEPKALGELQGGGFQAVTSRALRWTPRLVRELQAVAGEEALVYRFGPPREHPEDVVLDTRVVQIIPREDWDATLPVTDHI